MIRFAFISDIHVHPDYGSEEGFRACLRSVVRNKPDFVVTGGDHIRDSMQASLEETERQWELYHRIMREECPLPVEPIIGNHDVWGIDRKGNFATGNEPDYGKAMALRQLGLKERYRTFEKGGWRFIVLDSVFADEERIYTARLDDEQRRWLEVELPKSNKPTVILSHIPILSVTPYFFGMNEAKGDWNVPGPWMHLEARELRDLFLENPQVKLCVAGHMHQTDRVDFLGVTYIVAGSVSGACWDGPMERCDPGYSIFTLHDSGRFRRDFKTYRLPMSRSNARPAV